VTAEQAWKRFNLVIEVALGLYLFWMVLPEEAKLTIKATLFRVTGRERASRERRADLEDFERRVLFDIYALPGGNP
jgi:hypothetical protein